jgi:hypothetical protein
MDWEEGCYLLLVVGAGLRSVGVVVAMVVATVVRVLGATAAISNQSNKRKEKERKGKEIICDIVFITGISSPITPSSLYTLELGRAIPLPMSSLGLAKSYVPEYTAVGKLSHTHAKFL